MGWLTGYFDESGTQPHDRMLVVCGYISSGVHWKRFQKEWPGPLRPRIDPAVTPFHMTEFHARNKPHMKGKTPFDGWTDAHAHAVFGGLTGIIANRVRHRGVGIAAGVVIRDYEEAVSGTREPVSRYMFCVLRCLYQAARWRRENGITDDIAFVFEDGADTGKLDTGGKPVKAETELANAAAHIMGDRDLRTAYGLKSLTLESKRKYFPLQAADIAAWAVRRYEITGGDIEPASWPTSKPSRRRSSIYLSDGISARLKSTSRFILI